MRKVIAFFILSIAFLLFFTNVFAEEKITSLDSDITIYKDASMGVVESIIYDFENTSRHGIYRNIPVAKINNDGKKYHLDVNVLSVTDDNGQSYTYKSTRENDNLSLKIGDPDRTITGIHIYIIKYEVKGAIEYFSDHDELYWNVIGDGWGVPILQAAAQVTVSENEQDSTAFRSTCYTGVAGSTEKNCQSNFSDGTFSYTLTQALQGGEFLTIVAGFPKGIVEYVEPVEVINFFDTSLGKMVAGVGKILLVIAALGWYLIYPLWLPIKWYFYGRDPLRRSLSEASPLGSIGEVSAWFDPPKNKSGRALTAAETGTLIDENAGQREISAMIVDLARRGYLKIVEKEKNDFSFVKKREFDGDKSLTKFETVFLTELFAVDHTVHLKKADLYSVVTTVHDLIYKSLVEDGFFPDNPHKVRQFYAVISGIATVTFNFLLLIVSAVFGRIMPRKTMEGVHASNVARSLRNFLVSQERQLEFQAKNQMFFEKLLPYAIAFGVEKVWAKRFEGIKMKQPDWYQGSSMHGTFTVYAFTNSLNSSLHSFTSAATPTTSSSGFSSGFSGGSSGGGGGGGGGGSW